MECINCGRPADKVTATRIGRYRRETVEVESEFFRCELCKEEYFTPAQMKAHHRAVKNEIRQKYGLLAPERIVEIRHKLDLTQVELEEILATGAKVVARWENGKVIQGSGHDNILRLLDQDPRLIKFLRQIQEHRSEEKRHYEREHKTRTRGLVAQAV
jgi:putative zinc finger/helix-turn-helix YgiT family protein